MKHIFVVLLAFGTFFLSVSCSTLFQDDSSHINQKPNFDVSPPPVTVAAGDIINITSFTTNLPSGDFVVSPKGLISYPYIGEISVKGKTPFEISKILMSKLKEGYFRNPMMSVVLKNVRSHHITVFGFVSKPMSFSYIPKITILEAITRAGGFTKNADRSSVTVMRKQNDRTYRIRVSIRDIIDGKIPNFYLLPDDIIIVPERLL